MKELHNLELKLVDIFKQSPVHLPKGAKVWIGQNAWWLVLVGIALSILSVYTSLKTLFWADNVLDDYREMAAAYGVNVDTGNSLSTDISLWISLVVFAVVILLQIRAVNPLKVQQKSGWDLIFLGALISLAGSFVSSVVAGAFVTAVFGAIIGAAIGGFFLFETREEFKAEKSTKTVKA